MTLVVHGSSGLWAEHSEFQWSKCVGVIGTFVSMGNFIKRKKVKENSKLVALW